MPISPSSSFLSERSTIGRNQYDIIVTRSSWNIDLCILSQHDGKPPTTYAEKKEFKAGVLAMRRKYDEENYEEAEAQAYKTWTSSRVPSDITQLLSLSTPENSQTTPFYTLLDALKKFTEKNGTLPLSSALPDMKASTGSYIELQKMYKKKADQEKEEFKSFLSKEVDKEVVDSFVKNAHGIKLLKGRKYGQQNGDQQFLGAFVAALLKTIKITVLIVGR